MTRKEQIIKILETLWASLRINGGFDLNIYADAILSLPLDVPSDEEIEKLYPYPSEYYKLNPVESEEETILNKMKMIQDISDKHKVAKLMRDNIIKRNKRK
jgi:hypothetical protein